MSVSGNSQSVSQISGNALLRMGRKRLGKHAPLGLSQATETSGKRRETVSLSTWETVCIPIGDTPVSQTVPGRQL